MRGHFEGRCEEGAQSVETPFLEANVGSSGPVLGPFLGPLAVR